MSRMLCSGLLLCGALACSSSDDPKPSASGGSGGALTGASGASAAGAGGLGGVPAGAGSAGSATAGGGTSAAGQAGSAAGGAGGAAAGAGGAGGSGGAVGTVTPSAGCAKMTPRPPSGEVSVAGDHLFAFPTSYDGKKPMQVMVGFHANNNPITQIKDLTKGSKLETDYVGMFPKSTGAGWNLTTDLPRFTAAFNDLLANYCVDTSRVFATGHSSGAQMIARMLCVTGGESRFKAVAPVAASKYCDKVPAIPILYIQGKMDAQRGNGDGKEVVELFRTSNGCMTSSTPDASVASCKSNFDQMQVTPGCISYQGCTQPTLWCSHNDNTYNNTDGHMHGWPCFANAAIADFFAKQ